MKGFSLKVLKEETKRPKHPVVQLRMQLWKKVLRLERTAVWKGEDVKRMRALIFLPVYIFFVGIKVLTCSNTHS